METFDPSPTWGSQADQNQIHQPDNDEIAHGWPETFPTRRRMNWLFRWCSRCINYLLSCGFLLQWKSDATYRTGAVVSVDGKTYKSLKETQGVDPSTDDGTTWTRWGYEAMDVATSSSVGLVKVDGASIESKDGILSVKALDPPTMTTSVNGTGRPDGITAQVDANGKMSLIHQKRIARPISSTAFFFRVSGWDGLEDKKFTFPLNRALAIEKDNQFELASSFYSNDFLFEKGFIYQLKLINVWLWVNMYNDVFPVCMSCHVSNISIESFPLNSADIVFHFTSIGNSIDGNQYITSTVTFEVGGGDSSINGWAFRVFTGDANQSIPFSPLDYAKCVATDPISSIFYSFSDFKFSQSPSLGGPFIPHKNASGNYEMLDFASLIDQSPEDPHPMCFLAIIEKFPLGE